MMMNLITQLIPCLNCHYSTFYWEQRVAGFFPLLFNTLALLPSMQKKKRLKEKDKLSLIFYGVQRIADLFPLSLLIPLISAVKIGLKKNDNDALRRKKTKGT